MPSNHAKLLIAIAALTLAALALLGLQQTFAANETESARTILITHPITPGTPTPTPPSKYSLPFNRNENAVITNGPGEGATPLCHCGKSNEAIDFSPKNYGWTQILAVKPGHVFIKGSYQNWGNLVVIKSDVGGNADAFYAYYAHLQDPSPLTIGQQVADRQFIGTVGETGCTAPCVHIHTELRDLMNSGAQNSGNSTNHPIRRVRGIGWYPWYPNTVMNSGFVPKSTTHPIGVCLGNFNITWSWPAPSEFVHVDGNGVEQVVGYSWTWSTNPGDVPVANPTPMGDKNTFQASTTLTYTSVKTKYFFHLRVKGKDSGWASDDEVAHQGPYVVKSGCPESGEWDDVPGLDE